MALHAPDPNSKLSTALQRERRIEFAADALLKYHRRFDVVNAVCTEFNIKWRQAEQYIRYARQRILEASRKSKEERLAEAVDFYLSVINNHTVPLRERLKARHHLDGLLGLKAPVTHEFKVPEGLNAQDVIRAMAAAKEALKCEAEQRPEIQAEQQQEIQKDE